MRNPCIRQTSWGYNKIKNCHQVKFIPKFTLRFLHHLSTRRGDSFHPWNVQCNPNTPTPKNRKGCSQDQRIVKVGKCLQVITSNLWPPCSLNHIMKCPQVSTYFLNTSRNGDSTPALESLFQSLTTPPVKKFFWIPEQPLVQLEAISQRWGFEGGCVLKKHFPSFCLNHRMKSLE